MFATSVKDNAISVQSLQASKMFYDLELFRTFGKEANQTSDDDVD